MFSWGVVKSWGTRLNLKKAITMLTVIAFLFNILYQDLAWAIAQEPLLTPSSEGVPVGPAEFNSEEFILPSYLGHAEDLSIGTSGKTVIHIQDAHCNYAAQLAIYKLIEYLNKVYNVKQVNLEGGIGEYDLSIFTDILDTGTRREVADYFLREGRINGPEFFALNNPDLVTLWGIDSKIWYFKNLDAYGSFIPSKKSVDRNMHALKDLFLKLKRKIYSKELLDLDKRYQAFDENKSDFKGYITYLTQLATVKDIYIKDLKNIDSLMKVLSLEEGIDFKEAEKERGRLIDELERRLSKVEREELVLKAVKFKATILSQKDFYSCLKKKSGEVRINFKNYPNLSKYIGYIYVYGEIDNKILFDEIARLEERIEKTFFQNALQRELALYSKCFNTFDRLLNIKATKNDYNFFKKKAKKINIAEIIKYVQTRCEKLDIDYYLDKDVFGLKNSLNDITSFYTCANRRDAEFIDNTLARMKQSNENISIIVTGGFHTESLKELFKERGISYVSIIPNFKENHVPNKYFERLAGKLSPLEEYVLTLIQKYGPNIQVVVKKPHIREESAIAAPSPLCTYLIKKGLPAEQALRVTVKIMELLKNNDTPVVVRPGEIEPIEFSTTPRDGFKEIAENIFVNEAPAKANNIILLHSIGSAMLSAFIMLIARLRAIEIGENDIFAPDGKIRYRNVWNILRSKGKAEFDKSRNEQGKLGLIKEGKIEAPAPTVHKEAIDLVLSNDSAWIGFMDMAKANLRNSVYGRNTMDIVIIQVLEIVTNELKEKYNGVVFRIGGDEIGFVLPGTLNLQEVKRAFIEIQESLIRRFKDQYEHIPFEPVGCVKVENTGNHIKGSELERIKQAEAVLQTNL
ncbi:MAG: diguanylate cyclase, partial [Candidatus Omnitrophica bacterium]|nr:diguanylate cyclase [Candidatus Omnitrophota bacterium]